jgi:hypothetical protein
VGPPWPLAEDEPERRPKIRWERWKGEQLPIQHRLAFSIEQPFKIAA